jgi:hypothetical protein
MGCLSGCTLGASIQRKAYLKHHNFIPLRTAPQVTPQDQAALTKPLGTEYANQRIILENENKSLGPIGPHVDETLANDFKILHKPKHKRD